MGIILAYRNLTSDRRDAASRGRGRRRRGRDRMRARSTTTPLAVIVNQRSKIVSGFIEELRGRYASLPVESSTDDPFPVELELALGSAVLRDFRLRDSAGLIVPQIAVVGPTQVGKSTIVNLLLGRELASVNPLAGHTKHLQGFAVACGESELAAVDRYFAAWEKRLQGAFDADAPASYSLTAVSDVGTPLVETGYVIWDTPDFDSFSSHRYRASIMEMIGLADLVVVALSKEKYGDLSVWNMLALIRRLQRRLVVVVNKMSADARTAIHESVRERLREHGFGDPPLVDLPYICAGGTGLDEEAVSPLRRMVATGLDTDTAGARLAVATAFVRDRWPAWTEPVVREHQCEAEWRSAVSDTVRDGVTLYRQQYLDTQQYDAFRRAVIRLLELLEVPALAKPLSELRRMMTWPLRKIWSGVRGARNTAAEAEGIEFSVLSENFTHMHTVLRRLALDRSQSGAPDAYWWRALGETLDGAACAMEARLLNAVREFQQDFAPEVERAGEELFTRLKEHPATLNALRVARVTADAAGVVLVLKTGGMGVNEVVLTPAMLSLTSFLTEGAVGSYARSIEESLKKKQLTSVERLLGDEFAAPLGRLPERLPESVVFRVDQNEFARAEQALRELP